MRAFSKELITRWEYKMVYVNYYYEDGDTEVAQQLNVLGEEGWELVSVSDKVAYLKRSLGTYRKEV